MSTRTTPSRRRRSRPFTLIEIMIVVVIIGMLAALVGPNILGSLDKTKVKSTKAQLVSLKNAVQQFYMDMSSYPNRLDDLLVNPGNDKWDGPYLEAKNLPKDGWDNEFQYSCPGSNNMPFDIISYGADKSSGGSGYNEDLSCWN
ncbi:MAG TPA: type II secretion system major pseudopilin GspG [Lentisphaeria bacterium]|jgi:general secretion pathway protein G|nr:type II secretion system major pseudopilin GspG [Lentisphaerota bacterium]OQC15175.1 MAG: Type II secretion system protein G precursor [Lentisphaerae bacterium ADurb.Bin082]HPY89866.1 type II secretion system major pseudopilin GspG [Lentisphaeria bacterium]HQC53079.1 type II secretion system major pseudopilin GspG [Lentisphaeria bacterium]HQL87554.1 type II secretion system major pseudopilin GspG [Lentisphaeria bacterium]